jgi:hypothetical protein
MMLYTDINTAALLPVQLPTAHETTATGPTVSYHYHHYNNAITTTSNTANTASNLVHYHHYHDNY